MAGEHSVAFTGNQNALKLTTGQMTAIGARGIAAARFAAAAAPGFDMNDVLKG